MPNARQIAIAAGLETKHLLSEIPMRSGTDPTSYFYPSTEPLPPLPRDRRHKLRTAVIQGEPFDVSIEWQNHSFPQNNPENTSSFPFSTGGQTQGTYASAHRNKAVLCGDSAPDVYYKSILQGRPTNRILVLNTANEKKPGGDWEGGVSAQEEGFARRSNLSQALNSVDPRTGVETYYPLPQTGAIYSPSIVVFREGFSKGYTIWADEEWTTISVVSAPAVKRPKLNEAGSHYAFPEEKGLQRDKMKSVLRVAALNGHINLVLGGFGSCGSEGSGSGLYKNPLEDVRDLWEELLFKDEEFSGWFANIVFAFGDTGGSWIKEDVSKCIGMFREKFA